MFPRQLAVIYYCYKLIGTLLSWCKLLVKKEVVG